MSPAAITRRLREAAALADLRPHHRLHAKLDMSPRGITHRLREVEALRCACLRLAAMRPVDR